VEHEPQPTSAEETSSEEDLERPSPRGRGRGRKKKEDALAPGEPKARPKKEVPREDDEEDAKELSDLSTWVVPSWNDLIASLYRPDR
jgi:hypothetical protein